tara:strand:+ start:2511 stop:2861 length:351 start_codon:yes stop_codon:yes gene_type:complete
MSVYKEGYSAVQKLTEAQTQVYPTSCDYGAPVNKGDRLWNIASLLVKDYGLDGSRKITTYATGQSVEVKIELINEWAVSDRRKTLEEAIDHFTLSFVTTQLLDWHDGYITIEKIEK